MLLNCAGSDAIEECTHFTYGPEESAHRALLTSVRSLKNFAREQKNVIYERLVFNQLTQKEGERIDNFVSDLKCLALTCEFGTLKVHMQISEI